jgi:uncharacterized iron-regulated membrane protein
VECCFAMLSAMSTDATVDASVLPASQEGDGTPRSALFRAVWRWHFYAGLFAIPVIVVLSLSGIVYLFKPQIEGIIYSDQTHVTPGQTTVSFEDQLQVVEERYPDMPVVAMEPPASADKATRFHLDNGGTGGFEPAGFTVFVDPYTGKIEGSRNNAYNPAQIALQIHGYLMTPNWLGDEKWGDHFLELVAGWTVVLVVTGVYLWWPRGRAGRSLKGTIIPRFKVRGARIPWRDVHAITGVMFAFVFMFFLLTGLMWTDVWGAKYGEVATSLGATYPEVPSESTVGDVTGPGGSSWAQSELPVLPSGDTAGHAHHGNSIEWDPANGAPLDAVVAQAQKLGFTTGYVLYWPDGETGSWMATQFPDTGSKPNQSAFDEKTAFIDQYTAEPVGSYKFGQFGIMAKASDFGISLHEGREWGLISQLLALTGTLAILVSCATAVVMWYKRRPQGLGAPRRVYSRSAMVGILAITVTLGAFFPLVGISLVALLIFDFIILRRVPPLAKAFGIA